MQLDESSFDFQLRGGSVHSEVLVASATFTKGSHIGQPLPLNCTWYQVTNENAFVEIEGVHGAFFQPSVDDVDQK